MLNLALEMSASGEGYSRYIGGLRTEGTKTFKDWKDKDIYVCFFYFYVFTANI